MPIPMFIRLGQVLPLLPSLAGLSGLAVKEIASPYDFAPGEAGAILAEQERIARQAGRLGSVSSESAAGGGAWSNSQPAAAALSPHPQHRNFDFAAAGDNVAVGGAQGYRIAIYAFELYTAVDQDVTILDSTGQVWPPVLEGLTQGKGYTAQYAEEPRYVLPAGASLIIRNSAGRVSGWLKYRMLTHWED